MESLDDQRNNGNGGATGTPQRGLSPFVCACFTLNYLIGTGFLTLPWAFERGGLVLSTLGMIVICFVANTGSDYILSTMARAEAVTVYLESHGLKRGDKTELVVIKEIAGSQVGHPPIHNEATALLHTIETPNTPTAIQKSSNNRDLLLVKERKFELTELCQIFLGDFGFKAYGVAVVLDIYGFLWAYSSVFGTAMANAFPLFGPDVDCYPMYIVAFAIVVIPMSFLEMSEQATVQVFLSGCRIVMILIMVFTPLIAAVSESGGNVEEVEDSLPSPHFDDQIEPHGAPLFDFSNIHQMIPVVVFCVLFHQAVPGLADEMTDKPKVGAIFGYTFVLCTVAYSLIGIIVGWYFGSMTYESSNLNWEWYHAGTGQAVLQSDSGAHEWIDVAWWARMISFFVVLFPAIDVVSAFPLYALVLGNSLMGFVYGDDVHEVQGDRRIKTLYRAIAAGPPIFGALFVRNLGIITDYSGLTGIAIAFCFPALLYIYSEEKMKELGIPFHTHYERTGSSITSAKAMFVFGIIAIVYCFVLLSREG